MLPSNHEDEILIKLGDVTSPKRWVCLGNRSWTYFVFALSCLKTVPTKRSILSVVATFYDLLWILSPIVIRCKILLQGTWVQNWGWDDVISDHLKTLAANKKWLAVYWKYWSASIVNTSFKNQGEIHGFADASQRAYVAFTIALWPKVNTKQHC